MKQIQSLDKIVESLINLRTELVALGYPEFAFKINSCMCSEYPHSTHSNAWREKYAEENWIKGNENEAV